MNHLIHFPFGCFPGGVGRLSSEVSHEGAMRTEPIFRCFPGELGQLSSDVIHGRGDENGSEPEQKPRENNHLNHLNHLNHFPFGCFSPGGVG